MLILSNCFILFYTFSRKAISDLGFLKLLSTGEWWNVDPEAVIAQALQTGAGPNVSDAYAINGIPGPLYSCSSNGTLLVEAT